MVYLKDEGLKKFLREAKYSDFFSGQKQLEYNNEQREEWNYHTRPTYKDLTGSIVPPSVLYGDWKDNEEESPLKWLVQSIQDNKNIICSEYVFNLEMRRKLVGESETMPAFVKSCYTKGTMKWVSQTLWLKLEEFLDDKQEFLPHEWEKKQGRTGLFNFICTVLESEFQITYLATGPGSGKKSKSKKATEAEKEKESIIDSKKKEFIMASWQVVWGLWVACVSSNEPRVRVGDDLQSNMLQKFYSNFDKLRDVLASYTSYKKEGLRQYTGSAGNSSITPENFEISEHTSYFGRYHDGAFWRFKTQEKEGLKKKQEDAVISPVITPEGKIWEVAAHFAEIVFGKVDKWDDWKKWDMSSGRCDPEKLGAALCLLQLCVGSRASGVLFYNRYYPVEHTVAADNRRDVEDEVDVRDFTTPSRNLVVVERLTKKGDLAGKKSRRMKENANLSEAAALEEIQNVSITKPFQYYFLDPVNYGFAGKTHQDRLNRFSDNNEDRDCRWILFSLVSAIRTCVADGSKGSEVKWKETEVRFSDKDVYTYKSLDLQGRTLQDLIISNEKYKSFRDESMVAMQNECKKAFLKVFGEENTTHQLRRLYVAYSYQWFGVERMKEVAYARYVLGHANYNTAMLYMRIQVRPSLSGIIAKDEKKERVVKEELERFKKTLSEEYKRKLDNLQKVMEDRISKRMKVLEEARVDDDHYLEMDENGDVVDVEYVNFNKKDGNGFEQIEKLKSLRGKKKSRDDLLNRAREKVDELVAADVHVSKKQLISLRINTNILKDVWEYFESESAAAAE